MRRLPPPPRAAHPFRASMGLPFRPRWQGAAQIASDLCTLLAFGLVGGVAIVHLASLIAGALA